MSSRKARRTTHRPLLRRWFAVAVLGLVGLFYYRPLHSFVDARAQRAQRIAEVVKLQREHAILERRLRAASSPTAIIDEARQLGYIRPGEHLFIVKDIPQWRRRQNASRRGH